MPNITIDATTGEEVVTPYDHDELFADLRKSVASLYVNVLDGEWMSIEDEDERLDFHRNVLAVCAGVSRFETKFNAAVWAAWESGKLDEDEYPGTRKRRDPDAAKPGRKSTPKSVEDVLFAPKK